MATALEFYFNSSTSLDASLSTTYKTYLTCTVNRIGKADSKNVFVIAHIVITYSTISGDLGAKVRLRQDGSTDLGECADGLQHSDISPHGYTYNFVKRVSLDNSSHTFTLDFAQAIGTGQVLVPHGSIIVLEESANAEYNDSTTETGTGVATGWVDYLTLSFTPSATENYLIVASCETMCEDESDTGVAGIQLEVAGVAVMSEGWGEIVNGVNDSIYRTVGVAYWGELATGASRDIKIQMQGDGADDEVYCRKGAIIAIPLSDFENVYTDSQVAKTFHTTAQSDTDVVLATQACNAADHLVICGQECSNESNAYVGFAHLISAGVDFPGYNLDDRDEDASEFYVNFLVHGVTLVADDYDFKIQGDSYDDTYEGCVNKAYLAVCEIPAGEAPPPPTYIPKVIMIN